MFNSCKYEGGYVSVNAYIALINFLNTSNPTDIYYKVAQSILQNLDRIKNASIHEVADMCYVSAPTISRFCKKLGYESYSSFKSELSQAVLNYNYDNQYVSVDKSHEQEDNESASFLYQISQYSEALKKSVSKDYIRQIARCIHEHKRVGFFSSNPSYQLQYLQADLLLTKHEVTFCQSPKDQLEYAKTLGTDSIALVIKPERLESKYLDTILSILKDKKVTIVMISNSQNSKTNPFADYLLCFNGNLHIVDSFCFEMLVSLLSIEYRKSFLTE